MRINLIPQVREGALQVSKKGDVLTVNGRRYDFGQLPEGAVLPGNAVDSEHIIGNVTRTGGQLQVTLLLPIAWDAPHEACFPEPIIDPPDGPIALPGGAA
ncbi:hypothetical protein [Comamonas odontotermitis]|uniref:hypothetical protein n=1 Tax=Comamonas odontotermitis TaxID=379895 RepID=UPI003750EBFA